MSTKLFKLVQMESWYSHVKLVVLAKWIKEFNRRMLTRVTLGLRLVSHDQVRGIWENEQNTKTEHANHVGFLFKREIEMIKLSQWKDHNNEIEYHVDHRCCPALCVDMIALEALFSIPAKPRTRQWSTLEN